MGAWLPLLWTRLPKVILRRELASIYLNPSGYRPILELLTLPDYAVLQRQLNAVLAGHLPKTLRKHLQRLAIDLTLIPYHGQPFRDLDEIYRGQAKSGTSHFHAYATAYVVRKGQRSTVALTGVKNGEPLKDVIQRLLRQAASVGVRPRLLLLDRGFYSVAVVRYLQAARYPFLMPVVCLGRSPKQRGGPTGSYVFRTCKNSGWSTYTLADAKKRTATVSICVKCRNYRGRGSGTGGRRKDLRKNNLTNFLRIVLLWI